MTFNAPDTSLDAIRREIDSIDGQILDLLIRRFSATEQVRATKAHDGSIASSPFRPAREASMMRRLIAQAGNQLPSETLVRLWRVILSASIQSQAPVTLHMDAALGHDLATRLLVGQHFCGMKVELQDSPSQALDRLRSAPGDLALIAPSSNWASSFLPVESGGAQVIGTLPVLAGASQPQILVFGHAKPQPSGDDETMIIVDGEAAGDAQALWQARSGTATLYGLSGFAAPETAEAQALHARFPTARIAGRYPRPIKVSP